jgi:hypothetical protein
MTWIKRIFDFYLDASIHVAFAILCLVHITALTLNINIPKALYLFIYFGSITCYNFVKYGVEAEKYILVATRYHKNIQFFSLGCFLVALYQVFFLSEAVIIGLLVLGLITGLYALPVLPKHKNFRSLSGFKILIVATVWAGTTVILPVLSQDEAITLNVKVETLQRFLFVLILLIPFEIRDMKYDSTELRTLPQRFGIKGAKLIGIGWAVLFFGSSFLMSDFDVVSIYAKAILFIILLVLLFLTNLNQGKYFSSFWVEAIPIFWWSILLVGKGYF